MTSPIIILFKHSYTILKGKWKDAHTSICTLMITLPENLKKLKMKLIVLSYRIK